MHTESNFAAAKMFLTAATKFNVLEEALISALRHMKEHKNASVQEALTVGLLDWDVHRQIEAWETEQQNIEDSLPF
jgi:hypothetical protein